MSLTPAEARQCGVNAQPNTEMYLTDLVWISSAIYGNRADIQRLTEFDWKKDARWSGQNLWNDDFSRRCRPGMAVWKRQEGSQWVAVLVFKGSDTLTDFAIDAESIIWGISPSDIMKSAGQALRQLQAEGCRVLVTGHSLGGYLAEIVATTFNIAGVAFCAPGSGRQGGPHCPNGFEIINFAHDALGNYFRHSHPKRPAWVGTGWFTPSHSITKMRDFIQDKCDGYTNLTLRDHITRDPWFNGNLQPRDRSRSRDR